MGGAVALLGLALAQERALVFLEGPAAGEVGAEERVLEAMEGLPYDQVALLPGDKIEEQVTVVGVEDRQEDAACGGSVEPDRWLQRFELALEQVQLLRVDEALASLSLLELELACWEGLMEPQRAAGLYAELARTHLLAAQMKVTAASFHTEQARQAVSALVALGWVIPMDLEALAVPAGEARVVAGGPLGGVYLDGAELGRSKTLAPSGIHLVQVQSEGQIVAARWVELHDGERVVIWAGEAYEGALAVEVDMVARGVGVSELLPFAALVLDEPLVVAALDAGPVRLYSPTGTRIDVEKAKPLVVVMTRSEPDVSPWALGGSTAVAWHRGAVPGLSGGLAIHLRYRPLSWLTLAASIQPQFRRDALPPAYDLDHVWRMTVPLRAGPHWVRGKVELGPELGVVVAGPGLGVDLAGLLAFRWTEDLGSVGLTMDLWLGAGQASVQAGLAVGLQLGL